MHYILDEGISDLKKSQ